MKTNLNRLDIMANVLILAPHADDETLGVGGTIAKHVDEGDEVTVVIATGPGGSPGEHPVIPQEVFDEVRAEAQLGLKGLGVSKIIFGNLTAVTFPQAPIWQVNQEVHSLLAPHEPEILYVPFPFDLHEDHRSLFHAASIVWRPNTDVGRKIRRVLAYEVQSETHWNTPYLEPGFTPNIWVSLSESQLERKLKALRAYLSQIYPFPHARSVEAVEHLARWRGSQQGFSAAEGFVLIKETW